MDETGGEEDRQSERAADGVAAPSRLHDAEEIRHCFNPDVGAPEATHIEIGRTKTAMASRNLDQKEWAA
jgi:hypothetical protein